MSVIALYIVYNMLYITCIQLVHDQLNIIYDYIKPIYNSHVEFLITDIIQLYNIDLRICVHQDIYRVVIVSISNTASIITPELPKSDNNNNNIYYIMI